MIALEDEDLDVANPLRRERAERLMFRAVCNSTLYNILALHSIHYRDEPELGEEDGLPVLRRVTPLHLAARLERPPRTLYLLFGIYGADYVDRSGLRHFHVACKYGFGQLVEGFLAQGRDPDCPGPEDYSPLHYAVAHVDVVELLLERGARPNVANAAGATPLQLAAAELYPFAVDALLEHGAEHAGLAFPTAAYCRSVARVERAEFLNTFRALKLLEVVETRGAFELSRDDAREIVRVFVRCGALDASARREPGLTFQPEPGQILSRRLTLQNVLDMPDPESRLAAVEGCFARLDLDHDDEFVPAYEDSPITRACAAAARTLFRRWTADVVYELCRARLPLLVCGQICKRLSNEDLLNVFAAARL